MTAGDKEHDRPCGPADLNLAWHAARDAHTVKADLAWHTARDAHTVKGVLVTYLLAANPLPAQ
eukprot:scaffold118421_cov22-Tisochrysis_lutea.AAC.1